MVCPSCHTAISDSEHEPIRQMWADLDRRDNIPIAQHANALHQSARNRIYLRAQAPELLSAARAHRNKRQARFSASNSPAEAAEAPQGEAVPPAQGTPAAAPPPASGGGPPAVSEEELLNLHLDSLFNLSQAPRGRSFPLATEASWSPSPRTSSVSMSLLLSRRTNLP